MPSAQVNIGPEKDLPYPDVFDSAEQYISSLLSFAQSTDLFKTLCGGVHILDFFTNEPDLYSELLPVVWRDFIQAHEIMDFIDLLLREPLDQFQSGALSDWRAGPCPPESLLAYIKQVRTHLLLRQPSGTQCSRNRAVKPTQKMAWRVAVGMNVKKVHEVGLFASYLDQLTDSIAVATQKQITHLVDFGSGQNYLGRALASLPYSKNIVAIETRGHNQDRAKKLDQMAKLSSRERFMYEKKATLPDPTQSAEGQSQTGNDNRIMVKIDPAAEGVGVVRYVDHYIKDGSQIERIVDEVDIDSEPTPHDGTQTGMKTDKNLMVMSLHSCGNLVHHGLRSLILNESVRAVAMVGCCYNLITERLSPATYKLPELRPSAHPRVEAESMAGDENGFPMSEKLCNLANDGIRLNITARMMAVQAPYNWGPRDSDGFFTRHFYRALLQRIFLDKGVVGRPTPDCVGGSPLGHSSGTPIIIGSLRKACYASFISYVRGALNKLTQDPEAGRPFREKLKDLTDSEIEDYEQRYISRKKELSAIWSLMAFSAGVVEAVIVTDRYLWLTEQAAIHRAWVEPVFDYAMSPRNLVVVGLKP